MRQYLAAFLTIAFVATCIGDAPAAAPANGALPSAITTVMKKPRYAKASWSLLVTDLTTGKTIYALDAGRLAFTGSVRKLFSVGVAMNRLGPEKRFTTPVYRTGHVTAGGILRGNLVLVGAGDLTLGGRLTPGGSIAFTNFDHNDANNLGTAILTPEDPLRGLRDLARQVRAAGIRKVSGNVVVDDRLFEPYRVPNGNLLITPILVNENMVDVTASPSKPGGPARVDWRPKTAAFHVTSTLVTAAEGTGPKIELSSKGLAECNWPADCAGTVSGTIPVGYKAPLSSRPEYVGVFRVEDPASFARIAFMQALERAGITVGAKALQTNPRNLLPAHDAYAATSRVARFTSPPYSEVAKLVLKVSLNLGANLSLSLFGAAQGTRTIAGSLAAERSALTALGVSGSGFAFPTNGSGSPDSKANPSAVVQLLTAMSKGANAGPYHAALPILGVDGSLAGTGQTLPAKGHVFAKTGTTLDAGGLKAQVLAGYIDAKSGRKLAFALFVNDAGPIKTIADVSEVFDDEAAITNAIYVNN